MGVTGVVSRCRLHTLGAVCGSVPHPSAVQLRPRVAGRDRRPVRLVASTAGNAAVKKVMVIEGGYDSELYQADQVCKLFAGRSHEHHVLCLP